MNVLVASVRSIVNPDFIMNNNFSIIEAARYAFQIVIGGILTNEGKKSLINHSARYYNEKVSIVFVSSITGFAFRLR